MVAHQCEHLSIKNYVFVAVMVKLMCNYAANYAASAANGNWVLEYTITVKDKK